jgi:hypothetical protein
LQRFEGPEGEARLMRHLRLLYSKTFVAGLELELSARLQTWSAALLGLEAVKTSVVEDFNDVFLNFLKMQESWLLVRQQA